MRNVPVTRKEVELFMQDPTVAQIGGRELIMVTPKGEKLFAPNRKMRRTEYRKHNNRKTTRGRQTVILLNKKEVEGEVTYSVKDVSKRTKFL